jgi:predicted glycosyltransferase
VSKHSSYEFIDLSQDAKEKYAYYQRLAGDIEQRDFALKKMREIIIHDTSYAFNPDIYEVDRKIPKGGILDAIRDSCK